MQLLPSKYFNQRLLNYTQKFSSDSDSIFFAQSDMQKLNFSSQTNIAMRKITSNQLTTGMLSSNFNEKIKEFIASEQALTFMNSIIGTPAYFKKFLFDVLAIVKQLGVPTFFMTLSSADMKWNELVSIINKLHMLDLSDRCCLLNSNPVLVAKHFQYRVEVLFKKVIVDGPLGKTKNYTTDVEFQVPGSPHMHCFIWVVNGAVLTLNNKEDYIVSTDQIINAFLPQKWYQLH